MNEVLKFWILHTDTTPKSSGYWVRVSEGKFRNYFVQLFLRHFSVKKFYFCKYDLQHKKGITNTDVQEDLKNVYCKVDREKRMDFVDLRGNLLLYETSDVEFNVGKRNGMALLSGNGLIFGHISLFYYIYES